MTIAETKTKNTKQKTQRKGNRMKTRTHKVLTAILAACVLVGIVGCATTRQVKKQEQSGYLGDKYALLQKGESGEANYIYIDKNANWGKYTKVWLQKVEIWKANDGQSALDKMSPEDQEALVQVAYNCFHEALTTNFEMVDRGGPDVLVIQGAITGGRPSKPVVNLVTSVYLPLKVVSLGKRLFTGTDIGVGVAMVEGVFTDGQSGQVVGAVMDARAGTKALRSKFNSTWGDAKLAFEWWAQRTAKRLQLIKQGDFSTTNL